MRRSNPAAPAGALAVALLLLTGASTAQQNFDDVEIQAQKVADGIYMLLGAGGNIGVSVGEDGVLLVDDQYAPLSERIEAAVAKLSSKPIRFVLNTHWHQDHTGGNENFGKAGAVIVAHRNVRERMSVEQFLEAFDLRVPPSPAEALPVVTFSEEVTLHLNGEDIQALHVEPAHTDGDSMIHFRGADVLHTGDLYFNGMYPFIDVSSGGSIDGMIAAGERILAMVGDNTQIIPGHGPLSNKGELASFVAMLETVRDNVAALVAAGKSQDEAVAAKPTAEVDEVWGKGFLKPDDFVKIVYWSLKKSSE